MNKEKQINILYRLQANKFHQTTELRFNSPFELLIAVLLSAQTTDVNVNKATNKLYSVANNPKALLALGVDGVKEHIKNIVFFNKKAENIIKTCQILIDLHGSQVPEDRTALEALPGVGRKTANVVLNTIFGWPTIAVDTHVFRVCNRTGLAPGKSVKQVEKKLLKIIPIELKIKSHNLLVLHGRYICTSRKPRCGFCIINDLCEFKEKIYN